MAKATEQLQVSSSISSIIWPQHTFKFCLLLRSTTQHNRIPINEGLSLDKILKCPSMHRHAQLQSLGKSEASTQENSGECAICLGAVLVRFGSPKTAKHILTLP